MDQYLTITALVDLHINEITINQGNCEIFYRKNFDLNFGQSEKILVNDCDIKLVEVRHSFGTAVANF